MAKHCCQSKIHVNLASPRGEITAHCREVASIKSFNKWEQKVIECACPQTSVIETENPGLLEGTDNLKFDCKLMFSFL